MSYYEILTVITLFFLFVAAAFLRRYSRQHYLLMKKYQALSCEKEALSRQCSDLQEKVGQTQLFSDNLMEAEITTKLQATRTRHQAGDNSATAPERYNYINALSESGMETEKIAELLSISIREAEQLVSLSKLGDGLPTS